ncbi:TonB-dependent receptor [Elizabethkingia miricola]|uniref:TonB-dependent receptor n=1 Tax=Elizabethkingia miricola TaxID=172045 RepID=A0ABD4DRE8_ELIMR|nr:MULTISPECIES: TonB-dependent receptor [Elizabethkingia]KUY21110.1 TonB-dependent receptor [Elizabethkingia miricola]MCL1654137.1 TonB-dependent receptor [Elizabethkingia miricola]MCL1677665.1 TonB-dependent receptor [Elizabethkingia miricola]OPC70729.1 TonB-dependent receptor [Elizabethkingia miricola]OPC74804.1 TonB-dependent receptor [Elizabethkingia miricola]
MRKVFVSSCLISFTLCMAQEKIIDTVYVFDNQINKVRNFHNVTKLTSSDLEKNATNLSEVLRFQSPVYIKENGRGAVSSPSFRGTTAQQTAFVWNGININSSFLGQGDINNTGLLGYDQLDIKPGGGSVVYGSGAIGGSIHLNNTLEFNKGLKGSLYSEAGSYETFNTLLRTSYSNEKFSIKFSGNYTISKNDYEVDEKNYINRNGNYYNTTFNFGLSYKLNYNNKISWQSQLFDSSQHYPVFFETTTPTKYKAQNTRSLIAWEYNKKNINNNLRLAYTEENFQYYANIAEPKSSGGSGKNYIIKNDFNYFLNDKLNINIISEFQQNKGEGYQSGIKDVSRSIFSLAGLIRYFPFKKLSFETGVKKDFIEDISSPLLFSFSGKWNALSFYNIKTSFSKNFRYPSFNDLYWQPGSNINLKPETAIQLDMNHEFKINDFSLVISPFYIKIKDMIRWLPTANGYWAPINTDNVESYGSEVQIDYRKKITENHNINAQLGYSFTKSVNSDTQKQLMYVPLHKFFSNIGYEYKFMKLYIQGMWNGKTYTTSDESNNEALKSYFVLNAGISGTLLKHYSVGFKINNITNTVYETTLYYPLPMRNYSFFVNINF